MKLSDIIILLREKTEAGRVRWRREGDDDARQLVARLGENSLRLEVHRYKRNGASASDIRVTFLNSDGDVTDVVTDSELEPVTVKGKDFGWQSFMAETVELAERWALGSDRVLDEIFEALQNDLPDPEDDDSEEADRTESSPNETEAVDAGGPGDQPIEDETGKEADA